jgi:hypothetical protein
MIEELLTVLAAADLQPDLWELRDALWLAGHVVVAERVAGTAPPPVEQVTGPPGTPPTAAADEPAQEPAVLAEAAAGAELYAAGSWNGGSSNLPAMEVRSPAVPALRHQLQLARALKPFKRRVPASNSFVVDEAATAARVAEEGIWLPVLRPAPARWLDMALVVDTSPSMVVWRRTLAELQTLAEQLGAFRIVRVQAIDSSIDPSVPLTVRPGSITGRPSTGLGRGPATLIDPTRRRAILVVTDAVGGAWRDGRMDALLRRWGETTPVAVATVLPQRMWAGTGIRAVPAQLNAPAPGAANIALRARARSLRYAVTDPVPIPVMELSARWVAQWARIVADAPDWQNAALLAGRPAMATPAVRLPADRPAAEVVARFRAAASPTAFKLACYLSAAWLNLPVMRLVQRVMLPESETSHLAEVFLSGLLRAAHSDDAATDPEILQYDFLPGVRDELNTYLLRDEMLDVLRETSQFVTQRFGQPLDFAALLADPEGTPLPALSGEGGQPLAYVAATVLAKLGGRYRSLARRLATGGPATAPASVASPSAERPSSVLPTTADAETGETRRSEQTSNLAARVVEVLHARGLATPADNPRWTVGSGYLIGPRLVLTAAHMVDYRRDRDDDEQLLVRTIAGELVPARVLLVGDEPSRIDLALLEISDPSFGEHLPPVRFAQINRDNPVPVANCWAVGFPRFDDGSLDLPGDRGRDTWQITGQIAPTSGLRRGGLLSLQVTSAPSATLTDSAWEGMSGGVVFAADADGGEQAPIGVISAYRPEGGLALTVVPITAVAELPAAREWWQRLGVQGPDALPMLRQRTQPGTEPMAALPDPNRSRVVLIGASTYRHLEDVPAVRNNLTSFHDVLVAPALGGLAAGSCTVMWNPTSPADVSAALRQHAAAAEDTLLVYFAGHALIGNRNELFLCLSDTNPGELTYSALPYDALRRAVAYSPAIHKVVILDCCFSGRALASDEETVLGQLAAEGTYLLTATAANAVALAPPGERHTTFTGTLLDLLNTGIPDGPELLTFAQIYPRLQRILTSRQFPAARQQGSATVTHLALTRNRAYAGPSAQAIQAAADPSPADRGSSGDLRHSSGFPPHARNAIIGRLLGLEALAPNIPLIEAQGDRDVGQRLLQRLAWQTNEALDDPDTAETIEQFLEELVSRLQGELSILNRRNVAGAASALDELNDLVTGYIAAPYDPLMKLADAVAETAADYYKAFQAEVPDSVWRSTQLVFSFVSGRIGLSFDPKVHIQLWTEFGPDDNPSAQVFVKIAPRWLDQETVAALPRLLLHEYIAHVPQGPFTSRRLHPDPSDMFAEGWMDYIAHQILKDALERRGPSQALGDALIPTWALLYEEAAERFFNSRNSLADDDRAAAARREGAATARQLHDLLRRLPQTAKAADEFLYKLSFSLNVSRLNNVSRARFVANVRLSVQRAARSDVLTVTLREWVAGRIDSDDLFERIIQY